MSNIELLNKLKNYPDYNYSDFLIDRQNNQEYVMYLIVNSSLKMGKGKLSAQVGHGVHKMAQYCLSNQKEIWSKYVKSNFPKIVLKTKSQEQLINILDQTKDIFKCYVIDEGRTQIPENSLTVVAYIPMIKKEAPIQIKELKLL